MSGLEDLGPTSEVMYVGAKRSGVEVFGVDMHGMFYLFTSLPEVKNLFGDVDPVKKAESLDAASFMELGPKVIAAVIACSLHPRDTYPQGRQGDAGWKIDVEKDSKRATKLGTADQLAILMKTFEFTFPEGAGPFVKNLVNLMSFMKTTAEGMGDLTGASATNSEDSISGELVTSDSRRMTRGVARLDS